MLLVLTTNDQGDLRKMVQALSKAPSRSQTVNNENEGNTHNKNNGIMNIIVNHDEKLKVVENKINYIVNNFARKRTGGQDDGN